MGEMRGDRIEIEVTGVAHGGVFVARHEGRVVFVGDAIPGERVVAEVTDDSKPSFFRADTVEVLEASPHRRPHVWEAAGLDRVPADRAGGAEFGHIELAHQRELKRQVLTDALDRFGGVTPEVEVEAIAAGTEAAEGAGPDLLGTGWRTRIRLHVDSQGRPGQYAARSHRVIPTTDLPLAVDELQALLSTGPRFPGADHVDLIAPSLGDPVVLPARAATVQPRRGARGRPRRSGDRARTDRTPEAASGASVVEVVGSRRFRLDAGGFWQVHRHAAATLTAAVQDAVEVDRFDPDAPNLDLYGGVGLLAAAVGDRFGGAVRITSVEGSAAATAHARENLRDIAGATAETGRVDVWLRDAPDPALHGSERATIVLDPPRSGAGREVVDRIAHLGPAQVVYVACDPVALSRDVRLLADHGYLLERIRAFDLFPNTHHVEAVATFVRS